MVNILSVKKNELTQLLIDQRFNGSQAEFARAIDRAETLVSAWIRGVKNMGPGTLRNIESKLGMPGWYDRPYKLQANVSDAEIGVTKVPLISYVQAGVWTEVVQLQDKDDAFDWLLTDLEISTNAFALQIKGDSMEPDFKEGDRIIVDPGVQPRPGDFVVAKNGEDEATFKKYRPRGADEAGNVVFDLVPLNEDYPKMHSDKQPIAIIGTMVEHRKYRKR